VNERFARHLKHSAFRFALASLIAPAFFASSVLTQSTPAAVPAPAKLRSEATAAFDRYERLTDLRNDAELKAGSALLWIDSLPENQRAAAYADLKRGEVQIHQLDTLDNGKSIVCPGGMIHHWVGVVFIPGAKLDGVLGVLQDYDHQSTIYSPDVERSRIESHDGDHFRIFLRFRRKRSSPSCLTPSTKCVIFTTGWDARIAAAQRCALRNSKTQARATNARNHPETTAGISGAWKPGGAWRKATAEFTCRAKWRP
jgi:hypothetical protein